MRVVIETVLNHGGGWQKKMPLLMCGEVKGKLQKLWSQKVDLASLHTVAEPSTFTAAGSDDAIPDNGQVGSMVDPSSTCGNVDLLT